MYRERKCADTTWDARETLRENGWPFLLLKYKYNFQIKYTEAILSSNTRKLLRFEITKKLIAVLKNKLTVLLIIIFGTLSFPMHWLKTWIPNFFRVKLLLNCYTVADLSPALRRSTLPRLVHDSSFWTSKEVTKHLTVLNFSYGHRASRVLVGGGRTRND